MPPRAEVPRAPAPGSRGSRPVNPPPPEPRRKTLPDGSPHLGYPPLIAYAYLLDWLDEAGWCEWTDGVAGALSWVELHAWAEMTVTPVTTWEALTLHRLSAVYAAGANAAREPSCEPIWPDPQDIGEAEKDRRRNSLRAALRGAAGG